MRFGVIADAGWDANAVQAAEMYGVDLLWIESQTAAGEAMIDAALLAPRTATLRMAVVVPIGNHPVAIAEQIAVVDLALAGRAILVLRCDNVERMAMLAETVDVLLASLASRPFAHAGHHWTIPARLEGATGWTEQRLMVTPTPAQLELPIWIVGGAGRELAERRCLPFVADALDNNQMATWSRVRPTLVGAVPSPEALRKAQRDTGLDLAIVDLGSGDRTSAITALMADLRPRVQLDALPLGIEEFWEQERSTFVENETSGGR